MKKLLLTIAALLPALLAHSQEAESADNFAQLSIISRLEASPSFSTSGESHDFSFPGLLGESSLYTVFEGDISEHFSFLLCNHWLSTEPMSLYKDTFFYSNTTNWVDFLNFTYTVGFFSLTLGKDMIFTGGHENLPYDFDCHGKMLSSLWNNMPVYQWGASAAFELPWEENSIAVQMTTSPFGERSFASGLFVWSAKWDGRIGSWFRPLWSISIFQNDAENRSSIYPLVDISQRLGSERFHVDLQYRNAVGGDGEENPLLIKGHSALAAIEYSNKAENLELFGRCNFEHCELGNNWIAGAGVHYYPLRGSKDLRLHAMAAWNSYDNFLTAAVGLSCNLNFGFRRCGGRTR